MTKFNESNLKLASQNYLNGNICVRYYTKSFIIYSQSKISFKIIIY